MDNELGIPFKSKVFTPKKSEVGQELKEFIPFISLLESYKTRFKNLHWAALNHPEHVVVGDFLDELDEFQDELAEAGQGLFGQFSPLAIVTTSLNYAFPTEAILALNKEVLSFHHIICQREDCTGLTNAVEGFLTILNKYTYLFNLLRK